MPELAPREVCTGCSACASACPKNSIRMVADENGFAVPVVDSETCVNCGLCENSCPILQPHSLAGRNPKAYAAYSKDEASRLESSSGGVFTELARVILKQGGAVFGAAYDKTARVAHICAECEEDLAKLRGAKYAQSALSDTFVQVKKRLDRGQLVLLSGTPCQVGGLRGFLRRDYENLLLVDFVCHSVPSPLAWEEYVRFRALTDNRGEPPVNVNLRSKETGWSRYQYSNLFEYAGNKRSLLKTNESLFMKLFVGGYVSREACSCCHFKGYERISDLTLGDFWGIWDIAPEMDDNKGTSVVLVQSERGAEFWAQLMDKLVIKQLSLTEASSQNPAMLQPSQADGRRQEALARIRNGKIHELDAWVSEPAPGLLQRLKSRVKRLLK